MGKPKALKPGDTISLVSPASFLTPEQTARGIQFLESLGYTVKTYPSTYAAAGYLAGSDEARAADIRAAFLDPETQAVYCARGGYGSSRLVPYLDFDELAATGKLFIGFSDITILHAYLNQRGLPTLYGPMVFTFGFDREPWVYESFSSVISGGNPIPETAPLGETVTPGQAEGIVVGGCMCLICDLLGTPAQIDMRGKIVLIEDVDEAPHRVDGSFTHLINSGCLKQAAGIVVGEMTRSNDKMDNSIGSLPWDEIVRERLSLVDVPSIIKFPFGHMSNMLSLPLGIKAELDASNGTMKYVESLCE
jgi:muramoyltetrapeptide carboxypeptidase